MATVDAGRLGVERVSALLDRVGLGWVHVAVVGVAVVALAARLFDLGGRVAHWDEARVAYWTLRYMETGNFEYRPIIHGPFYHHVNRHLFAVLGATDAVMRLPAAVVGGLFPLVALLFRGRLRDAEVVALAFFFAVNPVVLYYSRFMRGDPLVAVFMFSAFALFVRAVDTRNVLYAHAGAVVASLGFTAKENALLYLVCWVGAGALVVDHRLLRADGDDRDPAVVFRRGVERGWRLLRGYYTTAVGAGLAFLAVVVYFYAPRTATEPEPGLWDVLDDPGVAPAVLEASTVGAWEKFWGLWVAGGHQEHPYLPFLGDFLLTMAHGALALSLLALVGFLADRYRDDGPSVLVSFCFYWGFASVLGYPLVTDIQAPWATIHAVVPLAVPAAVGLVLVGRWSYRASRDGAPLASAVSAFALAAAVLVVVATSVGAVYVAPHSDGNELVQYAQPADDLDPVVDRIAAAAADDRAPDVVLYGDYLVDGGDASAPRKPGCAKWFNALPLPWYFAATGAETTCAADSAELAGLVSESRPAVVVVRQSDDDVATYLDAYESRTYRLRSRGTEVTVYVHRAYADGLPPRESGR